MAARSSSTSASLPTSTPRAITGSLDPLISLEHRLARHGFRPNHGRLWVPHRTVGPCPPSDPDPAADTRRWSLHGSWKISPAITVETFQDRGWAWPDA